LGTRTGFAWAREYASITTQVTAEELKARLAEAGRLLRDQGDDPAEVQARLDAARAQAGDHLQVPRAAWMSSGMLRLEW